MCLYVTSIVKQAKVLFQAAFQAAEFLMDYLKTSAPFWKRAILLDGSSQGWVAAKEADDSAAERWAQA